MSRISPRVLVATHEPLTALYDVALLDLDGVVYIGPEPIPGAAAALAKARAAGMRLAFVTNNASRDPQTVAAHLV
ncbi:MAG: glycerol-phosphatase, partial [Actinomycetota bacterium]|nr:glycerol-phosphatase [Actinomycetota bacterium]